MITKTITASDGVSRTIEGKIFGDELRVYRVHGDVTNMEAIAETAQILALELKVQHVTISL